MKDKNRKRVSTNGKKLTLNMKTVRILNEQELRSVAGGETNGANPPPTSPAAGSGGCGG